MKSKIEPSMDCKDTIAKEIEHAPNELLNEVLNFIRFLKSKRGKDRLNNEKVVVKTDWEKAQESSFSKVWDNDDDSVYDHL